MMGERGVILAVARDATAEERNEVFPPMSAAIELALINAGIKVSTSIGGFAKSEPFVPNAVLRFIRPDDPADIAPFRIQVAEQSTQDDWWESQPVTPHQA